MRPRFSALSRNLKVQGYLSTFVDYVLEYDKKRHSTVYRDINKLRADWSGFI